MIPSIVYIYPAADGEHHTEFAARFLESYHRNPPGVDHKSIVVINGGRVTTPIRCMFSCLPNLTFLVRDDSGWDIGGYQEASQRYPAPLMVFLGGSSYLRRPGWLLRMQEAQKRHGVGMYGSMGNRGDARVKVHPHLRTTGFWMSSDLMNAYPVRVRDKDKRYEFEHGATCISGWVKKKGFRLMVVTFSGEWEMKDWDIIPNGYHRGDQSDLLIGDRLTAPPYYRVP